MVLVGAALPAAACRGHGRSGCRRRVAKIN